MRKYYEAYDERYKAVHKKNLRCMGYSPSEIVLDTVKKHGVSLQDTLLEIGCGEGRDSICLLEKGYDLSATDVSQEAVSYCKAQYTEFVESFSVLDAVNGTLDKRFDFIYSVAVIHMLVPDEDRRAFYSFIKDHLTEKGISLICTMGDGTLERKTDISVAFDLGERVCEGEKVLVAETSCRIVTSQAFEKELKDAGFKIIEQGFTSVENHFPFMMYAVVKNK